MYTTIYLHSLYPFVSKYIYSIFIIFSYTITNFIYIIIMDVSLPSIAPLMSTLFLRKPQNANMSGIITAASHLHGEITECSKMKIKSIEY